MSNRERASTSHPHRLESIEFEAMLLGRHLSPRQQGDDGERLLDKSAYTLLSRLQLEGPMSIGELSDAFGLDTSTLNRQTASMVRQGLVRRVFDPEGGMARKFEVTDAGHEKLTLERQIKVAGLSEILTDWTVEDVEQLANLLYRFNSSIERRDGRSWPRPKTGDV